MQRFSSITGPAVKVSISFSIVSQEVQHVEGVTLQVEFVLSSS